MRERRRASWRICFEGLVNGKDGERFVFIATYHMHYLFVTRPFVTLRGLLMIRMTVNCVDINGLGGRPMSAWGVVFQDPLPYVRCTKMQLRVNDKYYDTLALCVTIVVQTAISAPRGFVNDCAIPRNVSARRIFQRESALRIVR